MSQKQPEERKKWSVEALDTIIQQEGEDNKWQHVNTVMYWILWNFISNHKAFSQLKAV